jgi:Zn-dependent metalloprotease
MEKIYYNALQNGGELTPQNYFDLAKHQKLMAWATQLKNTDAANREWVISGLGNDGMASGPSA